MDEEPIIKNEELIYKTKSETFNLSNVNLFERQVESDSARLQKGEITLTDLAQAESSLAGANANLIKAKTELQKATERTSKPLFCAHNDRFILFFVNLLPAKLFSTLK